MNFEGFSWTAAQFRVDEVRFRFDSEQVNRETPLARFVFHRWRWWAEYIFRFFHMKSSGVNLSLWIQFQPSELKNKHMVRSAVKVLTLGFNLLHVCCTDKVGHWTAHTSLCLLTHNKIIYLVLNIQLWPVELCDLVCTVVVSALSLPVRKQVGNREERKRGKTNIMQAAVKETSQHRQTLSSHRDTDRSAVDHRLHTISTLTCCSHWLRTESFSSVYADFLLYGTKPLRKMLNIYLTASFTAGT